MLRANRCLRRVALKVHDSLSLVISYKVNGIKKRFKIIYLTALEMSSQFQAYIHFVFVTKQVS